MSRPIKAFVLGGVAGYAIENAMWGPRASAVVPAGVPFMPVWGAGAVAVSAVSPRLRRAGVSVWGRVVAYSLAGALIEYVGYNAEKAAGLPPLWGYGPDGTSPVDLEHALSWGVLGLVVDALSR